MAKLHFIDDFKRDLVVRIVQQGYSAADVAKRLGVGQYQLYGCQKKFSGPIGAVQHNRNAVIRQLKRFNRLKIHIWGRIPFQEAGHENEWEQLTRISFHKMDNGRVALTYDSAFSRGFLALDFSEPQQTLWPLFDALKSVPVIVIRGKDYDLLSEATVGEMVEQHTRCSSFAALNEAHAPLLGRPKTAEAIVGFIKAVI